MRSHKNTTRLTNAERGVKGLSDWITALNAFGWGPLSVRSTNRIKWIIQDACAAASKQALARRKARAK